MASRQKPEYQGGFLLDGDIRCIAGARSLLAAAGRSISQVSAFTPLLQPKLAPLDTVHATMNSTTVIAGRSASLSGRNSRPDLNYES